MTRRVNRFLAAGTIALAAGAGIFAAWPATGSIAPRPLASGSSSSQTTPHRWIPVPWQRAQLSVPDQWIADSAQVRFCSDGHNGLIFAGIRPRIPTGQGCGRPASFAWIIRGSTMAPARRQPTLVIDGFGAYRLPSANRSIVYLVPSLGVRVGAQGPMARQVLSTLRQSPLGAVLATGPASAVPANWAWHEFGGIKFASPRSWPTRRSIQLATCGTGVDERWLLLLHAQKPPEGLPCAPPFGTAEEMAAVPGLTVLTGKLAASSVDESYPRCLPRNGTRICLAADTGTGGLYGSALIFSVGRHHHPAAYFLLGLSGTGAQARAIFDSVRVG